jgi:hypothetical protein
MSSRSTVISSLLTIFKGLQKTATEASQVAKIVSEAAGKYEMDPGSYIDQAEGAFSIVGRLVQEGIIDQNGEIVKKTPSKGESEGDDLLKGLLDGKKSEGGMARDEDKVSEIVSKAIGGVKEELLGEIANLKKENSQLYRLQLEKDLQSEFTDLNQEEISQAIGKAAYDPKKRGVKFHAEEILKAKGNYRSSVEEEILKKYGIDKEEWERKNELKQQGSEGASALVKGKKLSFKKGEGTITPQEATRAYFDSAL